MRTTPSILFDVTGQQLSNRAMEGRPSSATFSVFPDYAGDNATAEFSGTATIDSASENLTATSGAGEDDPQRINVDPSDFETGRKYRLSEGGLEEWVDPIEIGDDYIRVRQVLKNTYSTAATLVGTTMFATVDATWIADEGNISDHLDPNPDYRVRWEYVVAGETKVAWTFFDVVRANVHYQVDISDVNDAAPGLLDSLPIEYKAEQGRPLLERAWRQLQLDCAKNKIDTDALRDDLLLDELVVASALVVLAKGGWKPLGYASVAEYYGIVKPAYDLMLQQHLTVPATTRLGVGTDGGAQRVQTAPFIAK